MSRVRWDHPRCHHATWICMCGHTRDVVIYFKFHLNPFGGFGAMGVEICPFLWLSAFTTACTTVQAVMCFQMLPKLSIAGDLSYISR